MDKNSKTFVVHLLALKATTVHLSQAAQIVALQWDKTFTKIPIKYSDYANIFSINLAIELLENISKNEHTIELVKGKQPPYGPIYALSFVELETLMTYIRTY